MAEDMKDRVREKYAELAVVVDGGEEGSCCGPSCGCGGPSDGDSGVRVSGLSCGGYSAGDLGSLPEETVRASLGCGNPVALTGLEPGEIVLDLGSGGGIDVLLSARRVSPGARRMAWT